MTIRIVIAAACGAVALLIPAEAFGAGTPSASCNGGGCGGWFRTAVTVTWSYDGAGVTGTSGCGPATVSDDTSGATFTCTVYAGSAFYGNSVTVAKDSTPPGVTAEVSREPDANGWYTKPLPVGFRGEDSASGVASCTSGTYSGPDGASVTVSGTCTDNAGNSGSSYATIRYDGTPPNVTGAANRPPDANGWYNKPVQVAFAGTDGASGIAACTAPVEYKGPDANPAKLVGQCRDAAGHLSAPATVELRYDSTSPARPKVSAKPRGRQLELAWSAGKDVALSEVVRAPGLKGKKAQVVFRGKRNRLVDRKTKAGTRYWYEVKLYDQAGNVASATVNLKPSAGVYAPAEGAIVRAPPVVAWVAVRGARFYNLQLWLGRRKLLTTWPRDARLKLPKSWRFEGTRRRLVPGRYRLYVWPAFGTAKSPSYGKPVGQVNFVVKKRKA